MIAIADQLSLILSTFALVVVITGGIFAFRGMATDRWRIQFGALEKQYDAAKKEAEIAAAKASELENRTHDLETQLAGVGDLRMLVEVSRGGFAQVLQNQQTLMRGDEHQAEANGRIVACLDKILEQLDRIAA
jgi:hypothetical protein